MKDVNKTKSQLLEELAALRQRIAELEAGSGQGEKRGPVLLDITRKSRGRYRELLEILQEGIWVIDKDAITTFVNHSMADMLGYSPEEMLGKHLFDFMDRDGIEKATELLDRRKSGIREQHEFEFLRKDGEKIYTIMAASPIMDKKDNYNGAIAGAINLTEFRRVEYELRESEERFSTAFYENPTAMAISTLPEGRIVNANDSFLKMIEYSREEVIGHTSSELNLFSKSADRARVIEQLMDEGGFGEREIVLQTKTGRLLTVLSWVGGIAINGQAHLVTMSIDITRQRQAEELRRMHMAGIDNTREGIVFAGMNGEVRYFNKSACRIFGYEPDEMKSINISRFYATPAEGEKLKNSLREEKPFHGEMLGVRGNGEIFPALLSVTIVRDDEGKPVGRMGVFTDISEYRHIEEELRRSEYKYRSILQISLDGFWINDEEGKLLEVNDSFCRMIGYTREELLTMTVSDIEAMESHEEVYQHMRKVVEEGQDRFETWQRCKDGRVINVEVNTSYLEIRGKLFFTTVCDITERKQAEQALKLQADLLDAETDCVYLSDLEGNFVYVNRMAYLSHGYTREEMMGMHIRQLNSPESAGLVASRMQELREKGQVTFEANHLHKDGSMIPMEMQASIIELEGRKLVVGVGRDIRGRIEDRRRQGLMISILQLLNSPAKYEDIMHDMLAEIKRFAGVEAVGIRLKEGHDYPYFATDGFIDGHVEAENQLCTYDLEGQLLRDEIGNPVLECMCGNIIYGRFDPEKPFFTGGGSFWTNCTTELLATTTEEDRQSRTRNRCNGEGYESVALIPIRLGNINIGLIQLNDSRKNMLNLEMVEFLEKVGVSIGIAFGRMQTRQALEESEGRYRTLFENANEGIAIIDMESLTPVYANPAVTRMLGYTIQELAGMEFAMPHPPELRDYVRAEYAVAMRGENSLSLDVPYLRKDGAMIYVDVSTSTVNMGNREFIIAFFTDVTERKLAEEEHRKIDKLESVGTLAGGIAHDFNNLLTGIMGNISLAKSCCVDPSGEVVERLDEAEKASVRARDLTQQLLTFSRGGAPVKKYVALPELIKESANFILSGSNVMPEFSIQEDLWAMEADEGQISQVIHNIVKNANEAMPEGGVVKISARNVTIRKEGVLPLNRGKYVEIKISDTGIGIREDSIERVFDPYFSTKQKGSGLGLTTSYSIIKNHGGHITLDSCLGSGTTFYIYLPSLRKGKAKKPKEEKKEMQPAFIGQGRVLIMDDEEVIRTLLRRILQKAGYEVEAATDGAEAVEQYTRAMEAGEPFDAVIMDLTVPGGMGGEAAVKKLLEVDPDVKAVVSSGYANDPIMAEYRNYGFSAVVAKPYNAADVTNTLSRLLECKR